MIIDFTALQNVIPQEGSITLTVKRNKDGKLGVMYKSTHNLLKKDSSYGNDKEVKGQADAIEKATKELDRVVAFADTPEVLTSTFEEMIKNRFHASRTLADAINESTAGLNERLKDLKAKKTPSKPAAKAEGKDAKKPEKGTSQTEGGLFGSITTEAAAGGKDEPGTSGKSEDSPEDQEADEEEEAGAEEEGVTA